MTFQSLRTSSWILFTSHLLDIDFEFSYILSNHLGVLDFALGCDFGVRGSQECYCTMVKNTEKRRTILIHNRLASLYVSPSLVHVVLHVLDGFWICAVHDSDVTSWDFTIDGCKSSEDNVLGAV